MMTTMAAMPRGGAHWRSGMARAPEIAPGRSAFSIVGRADRQPIADPLYERPVIYLYLEPLPVVGRSTTGGCVIPRLCTEGKIPATGRMTGPDLI